MKAAVGTWLLVAALGCLAGCGPDASRLRLARPPKPVAKADTVMLLSLPAAINLDNEPGPDGLRVQVYFFQKDLASPVTVTGTVDFMMFDGKVTGSEIDTVKPLRVWSLAPASLATCLVRSTVGWSYAADLKWEADKPAGKTVSLTARYSPPDGGQPLYASPVVIAVGG